MFSRIRCVVTAHHKHSTNKMKSITYQIQFYSQWHCGSGTSAGADVDELVVKDKNGMPFVPGKTLKGLIREATEDYACFCGDEGLKKNILTTFGNESSTEAGTVCGSAHFGNATLDEAEYEAIVTEGLQKYLFEKITTTAIGDDGVARNQSLRSMEVVVPCTLHAEIADVPDGMADVIAQSLGLIKRLGQKRNRGYGRCNITVKGKEASK